MITIKHNWQKYKSKGLSIIKNHGRILATVLALFVFVGFVLFLYIYKDRVLPLTSVAGEKVGGRDNVGLADHLREVWRSQSSENVQLTWHDEVISLDLAAASVEPNFALAAQEASGYGRDKDWLTNIARQMISPFYRHRIKWQIEYSPKLLASQIEAQLADNVSVAQVPRVEASRDGLTLNEGRDGKALDVLAIISTLEQSWAKGDFNVTISPQDVDYGSERALLAQGIEEASGYLTDFNLVIGDKSKAVRKATLAQWFSFYLDDTGQVAWALNPVSIDHYMTMSGSEFKIEAENARLAYTGQGLTVIQESRDGMQVDMTQATKVILEGLAKQQTRIVLPSVSLAAEVTRQNFNNLGISQIIGSGTTDYRGSSANRSHNVANGARILNGIVVRPGEEYSVARYMGEVSDVTGYLPELVIKGNRTIPEFGGGLCQVSTTLFRAVLNAGLRVSERHNHSYRVSYYEPPVGLDATIYLPNPDFKFINDTGSYILIQSKIVGTKITFELYGTSDGRKSVLSDPLILSTTPAPPPVYVETNTLFQGETKRLERAHDGMSTVVYYSVEREGREIIKQTFRSVYKPWAARYLVGTKERPVEAPPVAEAPIAEQI